MTIGERIESRRKAIGLRSQSELGRLAGVPQTTMNGIINRPYRWSPHLPSIARTLRTSVDYLVGDTDDPDEGAAPPPPASPYQAVTLQVLLPSEPALARMFEGLLRAMDRETPLDEQARLLARRLPIGLSQLKDLLPAAPTAAEPTPAPSLATPASAPR